MVKENVKPKSQIEFFINKSAKEFNNDPKFIVIWILIASCKS